MKIVKSEEIGKEEMFKLLKNGLVLQPDFSLKKQSILIQDNIIYDVLEIGKDPLKSVETEIDLDGQIVFPALINGHDHLIDTSWCFFLSDNTSFILFLYISSSNSQV